MGILTTQYVCSFPVVDFSFHKAAPPSRGYPWPLPLKMSTNPGRVITINPENFKFTLNKKSHYCDIIKAAFERYGRYIARQGEVYPENINARSVGSHPAAKRRPIETLEVTIDVPCDHYPSMESDESCTYSSKQAVCLFMYYFLHGISVINSISIKNWLNVITTGSIIEN